MNIEGEIILWYAERIKVLEKQLAEAQSAWRCFNCGFETSDRQQAFGHFGDRDDEGPLCVTWAEFNAGDKAAEYQQIYGQFCEAQEEIARLNLSIEGLEYRFLEYEDLTGSRFKGCKSINDAFNLFDSMEGRALAAEEKLAEAQDQLQAISDAFPDNATHKHPETGESLLDNVRDLVRERADDQREIERVLGLYQK